MKKIVLFAVLLLTCYSPALTGQANWVWNESGRMLHPVSFGQAVVKDSLIYILGGWSDSLGTWISDIQEYNPRTSTWRKVSNMASRRGGFYSAVYKDSIFMVGGSMASGSVFRPALEFWNLKKKPYIWKTHDWFVRNYTAGAKFQDKIYLVGGAQGGNKTPFANHYLIEYDLKTAAATYFYDSIYTPLMMPRQHMLVTVDSMIYGFGGTIGEFIYLNTIFSFNLMTKSFKTLTQRLPEPIIEGSLVSIGKKRVLLIGGATNNAFARRNTEIFTMNDQQFTLTNGPLLKQGRQSCMAVVYKNLVYVFGGRKQKSNGRYESVPTVETLDFISGIDDERIMDSREGYALLENYPNPFNPSTKISFVLPKPGDVRIIIFDVLGRQITELVNEYKTTGTHSVIWNAATGYGTPVASGVYLCRMYVNNQSFTKKMLYVR
ncbi:MAG: T9SS type A sorting domain-containing protein [Ignavibacteriales bacterium]|nr:T9SS type A sorting domain-containing protein [Ignavibacteriales bacterium]